MERRLIKIVGRKDVLGRPMLYGTTQEFLRHFGLSHLSELPSLEEFVKEEIKNQNAEGENLQDLPFDSSAQETSQSGEAGAVSSETSVDGAVLGPNDANLKS